MNSEAGGNSSRKTTAVENKFCYSPLCNYYLGHGRLNQSGSHRCDNSLKKLLRSECEHFCLYIKEHGAGSSDKPPKISSESRARRGGGSYQCRGDLSDKSPCPCGGVHVIKFHFYNKKLIKMQMNSAPSNYM